MAADKIALRLHPFTAQSNPSPHPTPPHPPRPSLALSVSLSVPCPAETCARPSPVPTTSHITSRQIPRQLTLSWPQLQPRPAPSVVVLSGVPIGWWLLACGGDGSPHGPLLPTPPQPDTHRQRESTRVKGGLGALHGVGGGKGAYVLGVEPGVAECLSGGEARPGTLAQELGDQILHTHAHTHTPISLATC